MNSSDSLQIEEACLQWCSSIQHLLDWLSDTEKTLLAQSASPADVKQLEEQIEEQKVILFFWATEVPGPFLT